MADGCGSGYWGNYWKVELFMHEIAQFLNLSAVLWLFCRDLTVPDINFIISTDSGVEWSKRNNRAYKDGDWWPGGYDRICGLMRLHCWSIWFTYSFTDWLARTAAAGDSPFAGSGALFNGIQPYKVTLNLARSTSLGGIIQQTSQTSTCEISTKPTDQQKRALLRLSVRCFALEMSFRSACFHQNEVAGCQSGC